MGRAGQARKKLRLQYEIGKSSQQHDALDAAEEIEESSSGVSESEDVTTSVAVLDFLGGRLDVYASKALKSVRVALFPLIKLQMQRNAHFEVGLNKSSATFTDCPDPASLAALLRMIARFTGEAGQQLFLSGAHKSFRRALHRLVLEQLRKEGKKPPAEEQQSLSRRISIAFRSRDFKLALSLLHQMAGSEERPRLGAVQRWVRDCDLALQEGSAASGVSSSLGAADDQRDGAAMQDNDLGDAGYVGGVPAAEPDSADPAAAARVNLSLLLLDAVMRAAMPVSLAPLRAAPAPTAARLVKHALFTVMPTVVECDPSPALTQPADELRAHARVISHTPGAQRQPPSGDDLTIYMTTLGLIPLSPNPAVAPKRHNVPDVPGAFLMADVLSPTECRNIISVAEAIGFVRDGVDGIGALVWLADDSLLAPIFQRVQAMLPATLGGCVLKGINARWRLFRYRTGVYRPHIDGAWPGSGLDAHGALTDDVFGDRTSKLTFLVYLNGGFDGGATSFFLPSQTPGAIDLFGVQPQAGSVLCFPHGDAEGSLVHEGSAVAHGGQKYVIRTDVLFSTAPAS